MSNADVFISYSASDGLEIAERVVNKLENKGISCWYEHRDATYDTKAGFPGGMISAVEQCHIFVLILNSNVSNSHRVLSSLNLVYSRMAKGDDVTLFPFLIGNADVNEFSGYLQYYLQGVWCIDATTSPLEESIERLTHSIITTLNEKDSTQRAAPSAPLKPTDREDSFIFISYAHKDKDSVYPIISNMQECRYRVWYDEGIDPGTEWDEYIAEKVEKCGYMIAFISQNYLDSDNCKDELNYARDLNKNRLLVYLEDVKLPRGMAMRLNRLQAIHYYRYDPVDGFMEKLMSANGIDEFRD